MAQMIISLLVITDYIFPIHSKTKIKNQKITPKSTKSKLEKYYKSLNQYVCDEGTPTQKQFSLLSFKIPVFSLILKLLIIFRRENI